jgi:hypothetical protein
LHGDVILALARNGHAGILQCRHHPGAVLDEAGPHKVCQKAVEGFPALTQGKPLQITHRGAVQLSGAFWIVRARPAMGMVQEVAQRPVGTFPARRCDVQGFSCGQLQARGHEVQLYPPAFGVLMAYPGDVILLWVETGKGQRLQLIHDQALLIFGRGIL